MLTGIPPLSKEMFTLTELRGIQKKRRVNGTKLKVFYKRIKLLEKVEDTRPKL